MFDLQRPTAEYMTALVHNLDVQTVLLDTKPLVCHLCKGNVQYLFGLLLMNTGILN